MSALPFRVVSTATNCCKREEIVKLYLILLGSAVTGLAMSALLDLKESNPAIGNPLIAIIFGSIFIAGLWSGRTQR